MANQIINLNSTTPPTPAGKSTVYFQSDYGTPIANTSAYVDSNAAFIYTGLLSGIPATATVGHIAFITDAAAGYNIYVATAPNTWVQQSVNSIPGGSNTDIQVNVSGVLGGFSSLTFDHATQVLNLAGTIVATAPNNVVTPFSFTSYSNTQSRALFVQGGYIGTATAPTSFYYGVD